MEIVDMTTGGITDRLRHVLANRDEYEQRCPTRPSNIKLSAEPANTRDHPGALHHIRHLVPHLDAMRYHAHQAELTNDWTNTHHQSECRKHMRLALSDGEDLMAVELLARGVFWPDTARMIIARIRINQARTDLREAFRRKVEADPKFATPRFIAWWTRMGFDRAP